MLGVLYQESLAGLALPVCLQEPGNEYTGKCA